jgi:hypothetical protein
MTVSTSYYFLHLVTEFHDADEHIYFLIVALYVYTMQLFIYSVIVCYHGYTVF